MIYLVSIPLLLLLLAFVFSGAVGKKIPPYDQKAHQTAAENAYNFKEFTYEDATKGSVIYGVKSGQADKPEVLFVHGTPGTWKAWGKYLGDTALTQNALLLAIDRPGFGGSDTGAPLLSLKEQAARAIEAAKSQSSGPFTLVAHSYGGPVALQMALDYPNDIANILLLASALDPIIQEVRFYHRLANLKLLRALLPKHINTATSEMLYLPKGLVELSQRLPEITHEITLMQGRDDFLVHFENADYAKRLLEKAMLEIFILENQGHFIPWQKHALVRAEILKLLKKR